MVDVTTIIFAILAIFVVWKLRSVLGTRTGNERPPSDPFNRAARGELKPEATPYNKEPVRLPGAGAEAPVPDASLSPAERFAQFVEPGSKAASGLETIMKAEPSFEPKSFLDGAKAAYEMIVTAFASGDRNALRNLLAKDVFDSFQQAIIEREAKGEKVETTFVSIDKATIEDAALRGNTAQLAVKFQSKLITATRDKDGQIIDGNPEKIADMIDIWTFARDITARDPNWKLVATDSGH